jgi:hypothetical protein
VSEKKSARSAHGKEAMRIQQKVKKAEKSLVTQEKSVKKDCGPIEKKIKSRGRREISFNAPTPVFFDIVCARCVDTVYSILFFHSFVIGVVARERQRNYSLFVSVGLGRRDFGGSKKKE